MNDNKSLAHSSWNCKYHIDVVYSDLNKSGSWIYRKGKLCFI